MPVDDLPKQSSVPQLIGQILDGITSRLGIRRLRKANPILSIVEPVAQVAFRQEVQQMRILQARSLDSAEGLALDRIGAEEGAPRTLLSAAQTTLTISDTGFIKLSSRVTAASAAPIVGTTVLRVDSALGWPATGSVYVGRRTPNAEGPLAYTAVADAGAYWTVTLSGATTRFHNWGEEVVVAQGGDRRVGRGAVAKSPQGALSPSVKFSIAADAVLLDGETEVTGVPATALTPGAGSNVVAGAVTEFDGAPFPNAAVTNPLPVTSGLDTESDADYRDSIRRVRASKQRATDLAIENAALGRTGDDQRRATSVDLVRRISAPAVLHVDDGTGYEPTSAGVGIEVLADVAAGGESEFEVVHRGVAKAAVTALNPGPYVLRDAGVLAFRVGGVVTAHVFDESNYPSIAAASPYDVVSEVNADPGLLWSARTTGHGTAIQVYARSETNDDVEVTVPADGLWDANAAFDFPVANAQTALLYKDGVLLSKDGVPATLVGRPFSEWGAISGTQTVAVRVDGARQITYAIFDDDFVELGLGFSGVGNNTLDAWVAVLNRVVAGVEFTAENGAVRATSKSGVGPGASLEISDGGLFGAGELIAAGVLPAGTSVGRPRDYSLSRGVGQIVLEEPLLAGQRLSLGCEEPRGQLTTPVGVIDLPADASLWLAVDGGAEVIQHGVGPTTVVTVSVADASVSAARLAFSVTVPDTAADPYAEVDPGDWVVVTDPAAPAGWRRAWRVAEKRSLHSAPNTTYSVIVEHPAAAPRFHHAGALLADGRMMVCGGYTSGGAVVSKGWIGTAATDSAEIFDPVTKTWTPTAPMLSPRAHHTATGLNDGRVLVTGGYGPNGLPLSTTEIWSAGVWSPGPAMEGTRAQHTATKLATTGRVLLVGGDGSVTGRSEEFNPSGDVFQSRVSLGTGRRGHAAVRAAATAGTAGAEANNVFVLGGVSSGGAYLSSVERYSVGSPGWTGKTAMPSARAFFSAVTDSAQDILVVGGGPESAQSGVWNRYAKYAINTNTWGSDTTVPSATVWGWIDSRDAAVVLGNSAIFPQGAETGVAGGPLSVGKKYDGTSWATYASIGIDAQTRGRFGAATIVNAAGDSFLVTGGAEGTPNPGATPVAVATYGSIAGTVVYDPLTASAQLTSRGLVFVRTAADLRRSVIAAGTDYTAESLAAAIRAPGAAAESYRTSRLRVKTLTSGEGDVLGVTDRAVADLPTEILAPSQRTGFGGLAAGHPDAGTPYGFRVFPALGTWPARYAGSADVVETDGVVTSPTLVAVGLRRPPGGLNTGSWAQVGSPNPDLNKPAWGDSQGSADPVGVVRAGLQVSGRTVLALRTGFALPPGANQPLVLGSAYAVGANDQTAVVVDGDVDTKRFVVPGTRRARPTSGSYSATITVRDADAPGTPALSLTFGTAYDFADHAVLMRARGISNSGTANKAVLWRWYRHGQDGENALVRYAYPTAPAQAVTVSVKLEQFDPQDIGASGEALALVDVMLDSGAERADARFDDTTRLALARTQLAANVADVYAVVGFTVVEAERTGGGGGTTRLRIQVPNNGVVAQGPQSSGLVAGQILWFEAAAPSNQLRSGAFAISAVGSFNAGTGQVDVTVPAGFLNDGSSGLTLLANPGTVSASSNGEAVFDLSTVAGDLAVLGSTFPVAWIAGGAMRVLTAGRQYLRMRSLDPTNGGLITSLTWFTHTGITVFAGPASTAASIAAAVNALAAADPPLSPVTATLVGDGTGSGTVTTASWDAVSIGSSAQGTRLVDGLNAVQQTIFAGSPGDDVQLVLKKDVSSTLLTGSDWANEDVRIGPCDAPGLVRWMNTPCVTGLWTAAEVSAAHRGRRPQIVTRTAGSAGSVEVQGGAGSSATAAVVGSKAVRTYNRLEGLAVTVRRGEADGIPGGSWVRIDNASPVARGRFWLSSTTLTIDSTTALWTWGDSPFTVTWASTAAAPTIGGVRVLFETVGEFQAIRISRDANNLGTVGIDDLSEVGVNLEGYLVDVSVEPNSTSTQFGPPSAGNSGVRRIVRSAVTQQEVTIWVENPSAVDEVACCRLKVVNPEAPVAGDVLEVATDDFGTANRRAWVVAAVGEAGGPGTDQYTAANQTIRVSTTEAVPAAFTGTVGAAIIQLRESAPSRRYKRVLTVTPNQDPDFADVQLDTSLGIAAVSPAAGSVLSVVDKPRWPSGVHQGTDGYRYHTGLVGEVNRVVYGDRQDEDRYPGYAAAGAEIEVDGVVVRRFSVTVSLRVSGNPSDVIADRVRSAVASYVNSTGARGVALGLVVAAAQGVPNVVAAAIQSPQYDPAHDLLSPPPGSRLRVIDLRNDVRVTFVGT